MVSVLLNDELVRSIEPGIAPGVPLRGKFFTASRCGVPVIDGVRISNGFITQQGTGQRPFPTNSKFFTASGFARGVFSRQEA